MNELFLEDTKAKLLSEYEKAKNPYISYSGGSDSDIIYWLVKNLGLDIPSVMFDTGLEYQATLDHIPEDVFVIKPEKNALRAIKKFGQPFISKFTSEMLYTLQKHGFEFDKEYINLPNALSASKWWNNENSTGKNTMFNINNNKYLKEFLLLHGLPFRVSSKCCDWAKKYTVKNFAKRYDVDLMLLGTRKAEGGLRKHVYKSCIVEPRSISYRIYLPLFWWTDKEKLYYNKKI